MCWVLQPLSVPALLPGVPLTRLRSVVLLDVMQADLQVRPGGQQGAGAGQADPEDAAYELVKELAGGAIGAGGSGGGGAGAAEAPGGYGPGAPKRVAAAGAGAGASHAPSSKQPAPAGGGCCIVYVHKRDTASELAARLLRDGFRAAAYSAKLKDGERTGVLQRWQARQLDVVVATVAFGMGIDRAGQRAGRGARDYRGKRVKRCT